MVACLLALLVSADTSLVLCTRRPIMDGLTATRQICGLVANGERPYTPIVVSAAPCVVLASLLALAAVLTLRSVLPLPQALTASCSDEERTRCADAGMSELMPKPIKLANLQARTFACVVSCRPRACIHRVC